MGSGGKPTFSDRSILAGRLQQPNISHFTFHRNGVHNPRL